LKHFPPPNFYSKGFLHCLKRGIQKFQLKKSFPLAITSYLKTSILIFFKETTAAENPNWELNLEPCDYQADALAVCYCMDLSDKKL